MCTALFSDRNMGLPLSISLSFASLSHLTVDRLVPGQWAVSGLGISSKTEPTFDNKIIVIVSDGSVKALRWLAAPRLNHMALKIAFYLTPEHIFHCWWGWQCLLSPTGFQETRCFILFLFGWYFEPLQYQPASSSVAVNVNWCVLGATEVWLTYVEAINSTVLSLNERIISCAQRNIKFCMFWG